MHTSNSPITQRKNVYQEITDYVIDALEKGVAIWRKPWTSHATPAATFPQNLTTGKAYKGWNHFYLDWVGMIREFKSPYYLTYKQAQALGGSIKKGSKGFPIIKWVARSQEKITRNKETGQDEVSVDLRLSPVTHIVFNVEQTENIAYMNPVAIEVPQPERIHQCEGIVDGMPNSPRIEMGGDRAFYRRMSDLVRVPFLSDFTNPEEYYSTLFHELIHSTGHEKRLNRKELIQHDGFGGNNYSREELTAEMGAAYLCRVTGIEQKTIDNSAAYIQGWLCELRNDKTLILVAAAKAQAAADYILGDRVAPVSTDKQPDTQHT